MGRTLFVFPPSISCLFSSLTENLWPELLVTFIFAVKPFCFCCVFARWDVCDFNRTLFRDLLVRPSSASAEMFKFQPSGNLEAFDFTVILSFLWCVSFCIAFRLYNGNCPLDSSSVIIFFAVFPREGNSMSSLIFFVLALKALWSLDECFLWCL